MVASSGTFSLATDAALFPMVLVATPPKHPVCGDGVHDSEEACRND